jgi:hypothetical protein
MLSQGKHCNAYTISLQTSHLNSNVQCNVCQPCTTTLIYWLLNCYHLSTEINLLYFTCVSGYVKGYIFHIYTSYFMHLYILLQVCFSRAVTVSKHIFHSCTKKPTNALAVIYMFFINHTYMFWLPSVTILRVDNMMLKVQ